MIKTGEKLVDEILETTFALPGKIEDKIIALERAWKITSLYQCESNEILQLVFGSSGGLMLKNDKDNNVAQVGSDAAH
jgi:hypothetical protein